MEGFWRDTLYNTDIEYLNIDDNIPDTN